MSNYDEPCGCEQAIELQARVRELEAERDLLRAKLTLLTGRTQGKSWMPRERRPR